MSRKKSNHRADQGDEEIKSKGHDNENQTTIENARSGFVGSAHERVRGLVVSAGELLMNGPLNAIKPLSNLNVVIPADIKQHESPPTSAVDQKFYGDLCSTRSCLDLKVCDCPV